MTNSESTGSIGSAQFAAALSNLPVTVHFSKGVVILINLGDAKSCAMQHDRRVRRGYYWLGPAGLAVSAIGALATASGFRDDRLLRPQVWEALFLVVGLVALVVTLVALVPALRRFWADKDLIDQFIEDLQGDSQVVFNPVNFANVLSGSPMTSPDDT